MKKIISIILLFSLSFTHPQHNICVTNIDFTENKATINHKLSINELELSIKNSLKQTVQLSDKDKVDYNKNIIETYFNKNFIIYINDIQIDSIKIKKYIIDDHSINIEFQFIYDKKIEKIKIESNVFAETFKETKNLIIINYDGFQKGIELTHQKNNETIEF